MESDQTTHHHFSDLSIFPPVDHEDLPIAHAPPHAPPHPPLSVDSDELTSSPFPPPPPKCRKNLTLLIKWFDFALHFWNSKLTRFHLHGVFSSFRFVVTTSFLGFVWCWVLRRRRKRMVVSGGGDRESVEHLKALVKAKDEEEQDRRRPDVILLDYFPVPHQIFPKIIQLLEQIAEMNKVLLARCRMSVSKGS